METYGWPDFVRQVKAVADTLPPGTDIFTSNYGEAGALTILGPERDCGCRCPAHTTPTSCGDHRREHPGHRAVRWRVRADYLRRFWSDVREIAPITLPDGIVNDEIAHHAAIYLCQRPHGDWAQLWPGLRHLD